MKKLLVLLVSAAMILSLAAVSMGAVATKADFRYELIQQSNAYGAAKFTDNADFRVYFDGNTSDTVSGHLGIRMQSSVKPGASSLNSDNTLNTGSEFYADEYWFNVKYPLVTFQMGAFDYKVHPSRILAKACNNNIFVERNPTMFTANIPFGESGFYGGFAYVLDASTVAALSDDAYDVSVGYKAENWGAVAHYYDAKITPAQKYVSTALNLDAYYDFTKTIRVYAFGTSPDYKFAVPLYDDEWFIGLLLKNIAGTPLTGSFEYCVNGRVEKGIDWEENPYGVQLKYALNNKLAFEYELTNTTKTNDVKNLLRIRVGF